MTHKTIRQLMFLSILLAVCVGPAAAHDTGMPHTHDPAAAEQNAHTHVGHGLPSNSIPMAFLVIPISGESFPFHWLWHVMRGETIDNRNHLVHEMMGWYGIPHFHQSDTLNDEGDRSVSPPQYE